MKSTFDFKKKMRVGGVLLRLYNLKKSKDFYLLFYYFCLNKRYEMTK